MSATRCGLSVACYPIPSITFSGTSTCLSTAHSSASISPEMFALLAPRYNSAHSQGRIRSEGGMEASPPSIDLSHFFSDSPFPIQRDFILKNNVVVPIQFMFSEHCSAQRQIAQTKHIYISLCAFAINDGWAETLYIAPPLSEFLDPPVLIAFNVPSHPT